MRLNSFFKLLNRKIDRYDKLATNPFTDSKRLIVVWVEETEANCPKTINRNVKGSGS